MPKLVINGAGLRCDQGASPGSLIVLPPPISADKQPLATVQDYKPMVNIPSFGMCKTQANPSVASATAAAQGVLTPMPCVPVTTSPWSPGSTVTDIDGVKALTDDSTCKCTWTGTISITSAGTTIETD